MPALSVIDIANLFFLGYFVLLNSAYLGLNLLALLALRRRNQEIILDQLPQVFSGHELPISILVPAYNEEGTISGSIRSLLQLSYPEYEVVVINDGSKDATLDVLIEQFALEPFPEAYYAQIRTSEVRSVWRSKRHPQLKVIDKVNGGKADALNVGINAARYPLFCGIDADSVLERDSLQRVVQPFLRDARVVATGGTVRVANGCTIEGGYLTRVGLPANLLALFQVVEYLRAFLFGRLGWSVISGMLIISGAFGLFRKETVVSVGGYRRNTIGEDMELIVRLHRELRARRTPYRIEFLPDPVCWTESPEDLGTLRNQRIRWQRGLSESLAANWRLMFSPRGGVPGWVAFPFMAAFEWLGPLLEVAGYLFVLAAWLMGGISWTAFASFLFVAVGLGIMLSVSGLMLEEMSFHMYPGPGQLVKLLGVAVLENFGYRQLNSWWRLVGLVRWAFNTRSSWGTMKRSGAWQQSALQPNSRPDSRPNLQPNPLPAYQAATESNGSST